MTNKEVFETLFDLTIEQLREMPQEKLIKWEKETNKILWGGFNGASIPVEEGERWQKRG